MARKNGEKTQNQNPGKSMAKPCGPSSDSQALKTRSMDEILGIEALDFGLGSVLTPKSSIQNLQQQ